ncbi:MAG: hypothetical protein AAF394_07205, partial [Planctomycetota bacterium]
EIPTAAEPAAAPLPSSVPAIPPVAPEHAIAAKPAPAAVDTDESERPQVVEQAETVIADQSSAPSEAPADLDSPVAATADDFDFMVRVDTASMEIPQPHFMRPRGTKQLVEVSAATPDQPIEAKAEKATPTVRDTIAQQMQASASSADSLDSSQVFLVEPFWGSLPNVAAEQATDSPTPENAAGTPTEIQSTATSEVQPMAAAPQPEPEHISETATSDEQTEINQIHHDEIGDAPAPAVDSPDTTSAQTPQADILAAHDEGLGDLEDTGAGPEEMAPGNADSFEPMELEAPAAPALSADEVRNLVEDYADRMSEKGEIFRLDAPSYQEPAIGGEAEESEELSSIVQHPSAISGDDHASRREAAYEAEEELRRVQTQRFNPAWEVDEFHWPAVCNELTQMSESGLEQVAANLVRASEEGLHVMAVTSPQAGEGRTTVACCLAKLAGANGLRVAFVDGDVENPSLSSQTNLDIDFDWRTAIINQMPLEEVAIHSVEDEVTLVPLVQPVHETEIASDDNRIAYMLQELSDYFDLVIVDMGHMESAKSLVSGLGQQGIINAVVTVVDNRISSRERIESCLRRIRRSGISSVGLVENFAA